MKKSHRDAAATKRLVVDRFKTKLESEVAASFHKVKATILQTNADGTPELRQHYARMPAEELIVELMQKFRLLMSLIVPEDKVQRRRHNNVEGAVTNFLTVCQNFNNQF